jgi:hypothetical protein
LIVIVVVFLNRFLAWMSFNLRLLFSISARITLYCEESRFINHLLDFRFLFGDPEGRLFDFIILDSRVRFKRVD